MVKRPSFIKWCWNNWTFIWEEKFDPYFTLYSKITQRIIDLNVKYKTIKLLEENIGDNLCELDKDLLDVMYNAQSRK